MQIRLPSLQLSCFSFLLYSATHHLKFPTNLPISATTFHFLCQRPHIHISSNPSSPPQPLDMWPRFQFQCVAYIIIQKRQQHRLMNVGASLGCASVMSLFWPLFVSIPADPPLDKRRTGTKQKFNPTSVHHKLSTRLDSVMPERYFFWPRISIYST